MAARNALNPIWEETFELEISLPQLAFLRFHVIDVASNTVTAQRIVPVGRLRPGYRHLRLHNEQDQPLPLSQLFICSQIDSDVYSVGNGNFSIRLIIVYSQITPCKIQHNK